MASKTIDIRRRRVEQILPMLKDLYPGAHCSLDFKTPLQLLVATILSAQCTDERVNLTTPALFKRFKTAADYADAPEGELETMIQSTGFFRAKAKNLRGMGRALVERHDGTVRAESGGRGRGAIFTVSLPALPDGVGLDEEAALKVEFDHGLRALATEAVAGATRFSRDGQGRHGS